LPKGIYVLQIETSNQVFTKKICLTGDWSITYTGSTFIPTRYRHSLYWSCNSSRLL
jgi:hypothetical protein